MTPQDPLSGPQLPVGHDRHAGRRRRLRWTVGTLAAAGLLLAGGTAGVALDSVGRGGWDELFPGPAATAIENTTAVSLAQTLDHVHDGIDVPAGISGRGPGIDPGTEVPDAAGILEINTLLPNGEGAGTGMVLTSNGLALTNYHVVDGSTEVEVTVADTGETHTATVVGRDATHDVAVLQIQDASGLQTISVDPSGVRAGEEVAAIGNGSGQGYLTAVSGTVTGTDESITAASEAGSEELTGLIATDADVVGGYSGGPLVDAEGQVVGMSTAASTGRTAEEVNGFAIPITTALGIADQVVAGTESDTVQVGPSGALGITITDARYGGALVADVADGSAAARAGVVAGDTITAVDGTPVSSADELSATIGALDPGQQVALEWTTAEGRTASGTVTLQDSTVN
jgi:S1-C subfamily serine protease